MAGEKEVSFVIRAKDAASAALKQIDNTTKSTIERMFSLKSVLTGLTGVLAGMSLVTIIKDLADLGAAADGTFRKIASSLPTFTQGISQLKSEIRSLAVESGRSLKDVEQLAATIAHLGVKDAGEVADRARAAVKFSDVTGMDVQTVAQGLDQIMDAFGLSGAQAEKILASLAKTARDGTTDAESLFDALQKATPTFQRLGIDAETGARALVSLLDSGLSVKQLGKYFSDLTTKDDVLLWAGKVNTASQALDEFNRNAALVREGTDRTSAAIDARFAKSLEAIGEKLAVVRTGLKEMVIGLVDVARHVNAADLSGGLSGLIGGAIGRTIAGGSEQFSGHGASGSWGESAAAGGKKPPHIVSPEERKAAEEAANKLRDLRMEAAKLADDSEVAASKSEKFADSVAQWAVKAKDAKMPTSEIADQMQRFAMTLANMRAVEQLNAVKDAMNLVADAATKLSGSALAAFDHDVSAFEDSVIEKRNGLLRGGASLAELAKFDKKVEEVRATFARLRVAVSDTADVEQEVLKVQDELATHPLTTGQIGGKISEWIAKSVEVRKKMNEATDPAVASKYREELEKITALVNELYGAWDDASGSVEKATHHVAEMAAEMAKVARSVIAAAQSIGVLDDKTASTLQNVATLVDGVADIAQGNVGTGTVEVITSVAALGKQLFGLGGASSKAREEAQKLRESIDKLFLNIRKQIEGDTLDNRLADVRGQFTDARRQVETELGGKANQTEREKSLDELNRLEKIRIEQTKQLYAAEKAAAEFEQFRALQDVRLRLLIAQGADEEAAAYRRQLEVQDAINAGRSEEYVATLKLAQGLEAEAEAKRKAADEASRAAAFQNDIAARMLRIQGLTREANRLALQAQQVAELRNAKTADEWDALVGVQRLEAAAVEAEADRQELNDAIARQAKQLTDKLNEQLGVMRANLKVAQDAQKTAEQAHTDTQRSLESLRSFRAGLDVGDLSPLSTLQQRGVAKGRIDALFAAAMGGDRKAADDFGAAASTFLELLRKTDASGPGFTAGARSVKEMADQLLAKYGAQETVEQQQLDAATQQVDLLSKQIDETQHTVEAISAAADKLTTAITETGNKQYEALQELSKAIGHDAGAVGTPSGPVLQDFDPATRPTDAVNSDQDTQVRLTEGRFLSFGESMNDGARADGDEAYDYFASTGLKRDLFDAALAAQFDASHRKTLFAYFGLASPEEEFLKAITALSSGQRYIPHFALGGDHYGGARIVGEIGPELEITPPAHIMSASHTRQLLVDAIGSNQQVVAELRSLRDDVGFHVTVTQDGFRQTIAGQRELVRHADDHVTMTRRGFERLGASR